MTKHKDTIPLEVVILTIDHEIKGTVYVSKYTDNNRDLTDLLNDKEKRFIAVTDAEIVNRKVGGAPRKYKFLEIHTDYVQLVHPSAQIIFQENIKAQEDVARFRDLRDKLNQTKS